MEPGQQEWAAIIKAGVRAQAIVPGSVAVGGTAATFYARHRASMATAHLLHDLRERFDDVREALDASAGWKTARVRPPVLVLGALDGVQVGFRQMLRAAPVETHRLETPAGLLVVPTLDEMLGMKAYMAYARNATRDYLDFAALTTVAGDEMVLASLLKSDERYGALQQASVGLEIAKTLAELRPYDRAEIDLGAYKGVREPWRSWAHIEEICARWGKCLGERLVLDD